MIQHLQLKNFKAWRDSGLVRLAPVTMLLGSNSSGKSSLGYMAGAMEWCTPPMTRV